MVYLTEIHKITSLQIIGYGDERRPKLFAYFKKNIRSCRRYLKVPHSSILRVLTENQMHPYKLVPTNELAEDDFDRRILFCKQMMQMIDDNTLPIENVLFSEESTLTLHGQVNRQNCRYWWRDNPHWMRELHTQNPEKVNVWAGIIGENIIGPFFMDGNLNGETYLALLQ
ncbi:hypothetical protein NQ318_013800 [Aromia moschata]|uniref:Uncharacterized protein n=1 Tax=Aromia moschata TaxID=1265417 RepID=A0AAV8ZA88_9CUCU|nr:hypothetical protein NQ318_013800 [Aromia moschata]